MSVAWRSFFHACGIALLSSSSVLGDSSVAQADGGGLLDFSAGHWSTSKMDDGTLFAAANDVHDRGGIIVVCLKPGPFSILFAPQAQLQHADSEQQQLTVQFDDGPKQPVTLKYIGGKYYVDETSELLETMGHSKTMVVTISDVGYLVLGFSLDDFPSAYNDVRVASPDCH